MAKEFHFYNAYHYGDNIYNLKFINNISEFLEKYNIIIHYYYNDSYIKNRGELERYIKTPRIKINSIYNIPKESINLWMGEKINNTDFSRFDTYYDLFYKRILSILQITDNICTSLYQKEEYLIDLYKNLNSKYNNKYKDIDILILNSYAQSGELVKDREGLNNLCISLNKQYNVCITEYIDSEPKIKCTRDDYLKIQDIGAISINCKYIIAVHSAPLSACYNIYTKKNIKKWFIFGISSLEHKDIDVILNPSIETINQFIIDNLQPSIETINHLMIDNLQPSNETINQFMIDNLQPSNEIINKFMIDNLKSSLKKLLIPYNIPFKKIRCGRKYDGGYIVFDKDLNSIDTAYSYGINDDVSFDLDFIKKSEANVFMFDHTINNLPINNTKFIFVKEAGTTENIVKHIKAISPKSNNLFLKMDIEGCEWDIINEIDIVLLSKFQQIVIEFHNLEYLQNDCFININNTYEKMISIFSKLNTIFYLGHIHGNNCGGIKDIPNTIECTYIRKDMLNNIPEYETKLYPINEIDYPCNPNIPDYILNWWIK